MGRDSLLKGTEEKKEKAKKKSKEVVSKSKKRAAPAKEGTKTSTKAKKSKTEKTTPKTVKKIEKPKEVKTSQEIPEATPKIEKKEPTVTPAQIEDVIVEKVTQTTEEPKKELAQEPIEQPEESKKELAQEPIEKPESRQEPVFVEPAATMPSIQKTEKNSIWIYGGAAILLLLLVLLTASFNNSNIFAFKQKGNTVELWGGSFAPMGMAPVRTFSDLALPTDEEGKTIIKDTYTRGEAYDIVFQHFLDKADETLSRQEVPDLKEINALLEEARKYALTDSAKETVRFRKNGLRFLVLMGKVNLALARNTAEELIAAKEHLVEIDRIAATPIQRQMAKEKASAIESSLKKISAERAESLE